MKRKAIVAMLMSAALVLQAPIAVFAAEDTTEPVVAGQGEEVTVGNVTITDTPTPAVTAYDGGEVTVKGSVSAQYSTSVEDPDTGSAMLAGEDGVMASGGTVIVEGDVDATGMGVKVFGKDGDVDIDGDVSGAKQGVYALDGGNVCVSGNVQASGAETKVRQYDKDGNLVDEYVSVVADGIYSDGTATVTVDGNVSSVGQGIVLNTTADGQGGNIIVKGVINANNGSAIDILPGSSYDADGNKQKVTYDSVDDALAAVPSITYYGSESKYPITVSQDFGSDTQKAILSQKINFIVKQDDATADKYTVLSELRKVGDLDTVHVNEEVKVQAAEGYTVSGGENVSVTDNQDGTYTLQLTNFKGMFSIYALLKAIGEANGQDINDVEVAVVVDQNTGEVAVYEDPNAAPAGAVVVSAGSDPAPAGQSSVSVDPSSVAEGAIVVSKPSETTGNTQGDAAQPTRSVSYDITKVTPEQYKASVIDNVAAAPANGTLRISTNRVSCFDESMINAIAARSDIDVEVCFVLGGKTMRVVIPKGYDVKSLLDKNGYCGFLHLAQVLGAEEV